MEAKECCPYCGSEIMKGARKCKYCGEFLDENLRRIRADEMVMEGPPPSNGLAVAAVALGVAAFFTVGLTAIPAIVCGALGISNANKHPSRPGHGLAVAGLTLGIVGIFFLLLAVVAAFLLPALLSNFPLLVLESSADTNLAAINSAACSFHSENGRYPESFRDIMENMGVIPERWNDDNSFVKQGYTFTYHPRFEGEEVVDYVIVASPLFSFSRKARTFLVSPSGEMRATDRSLLPLDYETAKELYQKSEEWRVRDGRTSVVVPPNPSEKK